MSQALFEKVLARAMTAKDPVAALHRASRNRRLPAQVRQALQNVDADGVRLTALLVAKLRFERLLRGSNQAGQWFNQDPSGFTEAFRRYHTRVPMTAFFPSEEARLFERWLQERGYNSFQ